MDYYAGTQIQDMRDWETTPAGEMHGTDSGAGTRMPTPNEQDDRSRKAAVVDDTRDGLCTGAR